MIPLSLEYDGTNQTLADWGFSTPRFYPNSKGVSRFTCIKAGGDPAATPDIPFEGAVIIYGTLAGMNSGAEVVIFKGIRTDLNGTAAPGARNVSYEFSDAWYQLERT